MGDTKPSSLQIDAFPNDFSHRDQRCGLLDSEPEQVAKMLSYEDFEKLLDKNGRWILFFFGGSVFLLVLAWTLSDTASRPWGANMVPINATAQIDSYGNVWLESTVEINDITVYYYHNIPTFSAPNFIFFHGGGSDGTEGISIFAPIAKDFRILLPSARGFGKTTLAQPSGTAQMVKDAEALISRLIDTGRETIFVAGHSMGATVAPRVAKLHGDYVAKLVLEDPGWLRREGEDPSKNRPGSQPRGGDDLSNESVEAIVVPTLILTAEFGDGVPEVINAALGTYQQGLKQYFPKAGHCIHCDFPQDYLAVLKEFLGK